MREADDKKTERERPRNIQGLKEDEKKREK